mgnify:CR=1 FL=1
MVSTTDRENCRLSVPNYADAVGAPGRTVEHDGHESDHNLTRLGRVVPLGAPASSCWAAASVTSGVASDPERR